MNFIKREYAKQRVKHEFELNKTVNDPKKLKELFNKAQNNLELIKRQVILHIALIITYLLYLHANQIEFEVEKKKVIFKNSVLYLG